jgi:hypothetical protein
MIVLIVMMSLLVPCLALSLYYNFKFGVLILKYVDQIEETLDVFDENYSNLSEVIEMPVFYDSPQVRSVIQDIGNCRDSILKAANILGNVEEEEEEA